MTDDTDATGTEATEGTENGGPARPFTELVVQLRKMGVLREEHLEALDDPDIDEEEAVALLVERVNVDESQITAAIEAVFEGISRDRAFKYSLDVDTETRRERATRRLNQYGVLTELPEYAKHHDGEDVSGLLLSDRIKALSDREDDEALIHPFDEDRLRSAAYELRVGDEYQRDGNRHRLTDDPGDVIEIPPFGAAVVKTMELINMPRFLAGRLNIKVEWAQQGMMWIGGPMVDPGYVGHLYCPVFNLSNNEIELERGQPFGTIDFLTTTAYDQDHEDTIDYIGKGDERQVNKNDHNVTFEDYEGKNLESMTLRVDEQKERIDEVESEVHRMSNVLFISLGAIFTVLAVIVTTLSVLVGESLSTNVPNWTYPVVVVLVVLGAIVMTTRISGRSSSPLRRLQGE